MSELTKEKIYKKELEKVGGEGNNNLERIRSLAGAGAFENIVDKNGNPRFIEGNGTPSTIDGFTATYCKWSLSGTHLMLVLAGSFEESFVISSNIEIANFNVPNFIFNKIATVFGSVLETKGVVLYAEDWSTQNLNVQFRKANNTLLFSFGNNVTLTAKRYFRVQFDLLIDSE